MTIKLLPEQQEASDKLALLGGMIRALNEKKVGVRLKDQLVEALQLAVEALVAEFQRQQREIIHNSECPAHVLQQRVTALRRELSRIASYQPDARMQTIASSALGYDDSEAVSMIRHATDIDGRYLAPKAVAKEDEDDE